MRFRDLIVGSRFKFNNGVSTFDSECVKTSARGYTWNDGKSSSKVGTINVQVVEVK